MWQQDVKTTSTSTTTTTMTYVLGGRQQVTTTAVTGQSPSTSTRSAFTLPGGVLATRKDNDNLIEQATDPLGTPIAALDAKTGLVGEHLRAPYGQPRYNAEASANGGMHTALGFTGQREDTQAPGSSGLDYFHARYYDPNVGRFISADTARPGLGDPSGMDAYGYVGGMVENATDPSGHGLIQWENRDGIALGRDPGNISPMNIQTLKDMGQFFFGAESIHDDLRAIMDNKASLQTKVAAAQDLANNVELDLLMVIGVGEEIRAADMGADVARSADAAARTVDDAARTTRRVDDVVHTCGEECPPHVDDPHSTSPTTDPTNPGTENPGGCSFSANTVVATPQGERAIGSLKVGDQVKAYNPSTGKAEAETVQHVWINHDHDLVDVRVVPAGTAAASVTSTQVVAGASSGHGLLVSDDATTTVHLTTQRLGTVDSGDTIHTTANHPWLTVDRGWVPAGDLRAGEQVVTLNGAAGSVAWVRVVPGQADMYNLTVANVHTYAVGGGQWVVHNTKFCKWGSDRPQIDNHVFSKHAQSNPSADMNVTRFPNDNPQDISNIIYSAWENKQPVGRWTAHPGGSLGGRDLTGTMFHRWEGVAQTPFGPMKIEGVYNLFYDLIETAYPGRTGLP